MTESQLPSVFKQPFEPSLPSTVSIRQLESLAVHAAASGMFQRFKNASAAVMVMAMAAELRLSPVIGLNSIYFYDGKPTMSGNLLWSLVQRNPEYAGTRILQRNSQGCKIEWVRNGMVQGVSEWNEEDTKRSGLGTKDNWKKYPRAMSFNRAIGEGFRAYAPHLGMGYTIYTPDELGADIDESGEVRAVVADSSFPTPSKRLAAVCQKLGWTHKAVAEWLDVTELDLDSITDDECERLEAFVKARESLLPPLDQPVQGV